MYSVFIVEDDGGIAEGIKLRAEKWGYKVFCASDLRNVIEEFSSCAPDIVLLDISLPFFDGYYWCRKIREISAVPIIFISSASDNMNIVMAMNMGGDDFIAKPFDISVLIAKLGALLRRAYGYPAIQPVLTHMGASLNTRDGSLRIGERKIELTKNEYRIMLCLLENKGNTVSREKLMERLWETDQFVDENTLTVNVNRLRKKLDSEGLCNFIVTKFGVGYIVGEGGDEE